MKEPTKAEIMLDQVTRSNNLMNQLKLCKDYPIPPVSLDLRPSTKANIRAYQESVQGRIDQLAAVKKRTPVGVPPTWIEGEKALEYWSGYDGGNLRDAWAVMPVGHRGDHYTVVILNNLKYASYVEYGHRQTPGREVGVIERHLKQSWVKGRFMLTISTQELETQAPAILEKKLYKFLKQSMGQGK